MVNGSARGTPDSRPTSLDKYNPLDSWSKSSPGIFRIRVRLRWISIILLVARLMALCGVSRYPPNDIGHDARQRLDLSNRDAAFECNVKFYF